MRLIDFAKTHQSRFTAVVRVLALIKVLFGVAGVIATVAVGGIKPSLLLYTAYVLTFVAAGLWLETSNRTDRAAQSLALVFFFVASAFAEPLILNSRASIFMPGETAELLLILEPEAWLSFFFAAFVIDFPKIRFTPLPRAFLRFAIFAWWLGFILFLVNTLRIVIDVRNVLPLVGKLLEPDRSEPSLFWPILMTAVLPSVLVAVWKTRIASPLERRRAAFFAKGLVLGIAPLLAHLIAEGWSPTYREFLLVPRHERYAQLVIYPAFLSIPVTTAYCVLVHRVFDVRQLVRRAIQYGLARYSVLTIAALPLLAFVGYIYFHRNESVGALISGPGAPILFSAALLGLATYRFRQPILTAIDRRFFREQYDARTIVASLIDKAKDVRTLEDLVELTEVTIDQALHLQPVHFLLLESSQHQFRSPNKKIRPLDSASAIAQMVQSDIGSVLVDPEDPQSIFPRLPVEDRDWVTNEGYRFIIPVIGGKRDLLGLVALGEKKSELGYSTDDRNLLTDIAASAALAIENQLLRSSSTFHSHRNVSIAPNLTDVDGIGFCCSQCNAVQEKPDGKCANCGGTTSPMNVPYVIAGKFRVERKIGSGGMGVVYQATDLTLGRTVAVKTLPRLSAEYALRLRQEARAVAAITHLNLATIYTAETWRGIPILIFEYLPGGTLADRLRKGPLSLRDTIDLGMALCDALNGIHRVGILHRDIKPSNIGFAGDGTPKLLDFGLAKLLSDQMPANVRSHAASEVHSSNTTEVLRAATSESSAAYMVGTPAYLSPETVRGEEADVHCDLWSLTLSLYEAVAGYNPFASPTLQETFRRIRSAGVPNLRDSLTDTSESVSRLFKDALAKDKNHRPATASELKARLQSIL